VKYPKIGTKPKKTRKPIPAGDVCVKCGTKDGTICARHSESRVIKFLDGGGIMGGKINDNLTAFLCMECDCELSAPLPKDASQEAINLHALEWAILIIKTHLLS